MPIPDCEQYALCYENSPLTCVDGNLVIEECKQASPFCDSCYPASECGSGSKDESGKFVESDSCGPEFAQCNLGSPCFDHKSGMCAFDGSILIEECKEAELFCKACFPHSRCGTLEEEEEEEEDEEEATDSMNEPSPEDEFFDDEPSEAPTSSAYKASNIIVLMSISFSLLSWF
mmetsp:Transcript_5297/g.6675  ORF Transcript_5297/g.6675 Transcript_5297/m.6675 type:complete len:174 (+) Transcript_5297:1-522(+)